ncbi:MATE family efflux transporter [Salinadaptatus halalkaliphilus]|uniref:Multidrug-efflux transporter n=1 Tax=Salinadaptatus halalkaliphilus TaxID=2419781 RepID=A0A4S3TGZ8_9EURY|nr:MATE family efflux transporter [Salinadaptatus halalkaliphilus]THE63171.1 MATE family efflux transporter [Salinadaptatus halalkaliphilus]
MDSLADRTRSVWKRAVALGWPIAVQQTLNTMMRTVDIIVTGLFSPAAVAAVGLADLYAQIPLRIGLGLGTGAIAISSQDTGRGARNVRDRAITQALLIGILCGLPLVVVGVSFSHVLIDVLGAESDVVRLGGVYLLFVFAAAPMRITGLVGARSLQGTGDTRTPMLINGSTNALNILLTVALGLGVWIVPSLGVAGVGIATAISRTVEALAITGAIASSRTTLSLARPRDLAVTRQLVEVSIPTFAEGMSTSLANFPFNALLLLFGTEANAAYHVARRIYQQFTGPLYRSFATTASIIVGQQLGDGRPDDARFSASALVVLGVLVLGGTGVGLFVGASQLVSVFTQDPQTVAYAIEFTRVFGISMVFFGVFFPLAGALRGAGDTRTPFYARFTGAFVCMLGVSYLLGVPLGYGLPGIYVGIFLSYVCWAVVVGVGFLWGSWVETATAMMRERDAAAEDDRPVQ